MHLSRADKEMLAAALAEKRLRLSKRECESLAGFIREAWHVVEPGQPYSHNWHIDAVCDHLEAVFRSEAGDGDLLRLLANVPPGTMKSLIVCVFFCAWVWGPMGCPSKRFLATSHNERNAIRDTLKCRRLIESEWYQRRWGDTVQLTGDQNAKTKFENTATGFRQGVPFTSMTGERADFVILDDPMSVDDAVSDKTRDSINLTFREALPTRLNNPDRSAIIVIMQRLHEDDTSGVILAGDYGYEHLMLPMRFDPERRCETSLGFVDPRTEEGELLFPDRFPEWVVQRDETIMGPIATAGQMQQSPIPRGGSIIKRDYWQLWEAEKYPDFEFIVASADTAYTEKEENDPTGFSVWGVFRDNLDRPKVLLMWSWAKHKELHGQLPEKLPNETKRQYDTRCIKADAWGIVEWIAFSCRRFKVDKLLIEAKASGLTVAQEMQRLYREDGWSIELIKPIGDKVARTHAVEPSFAAGLIYATDDDFAEKLIAQSEVFPKGKHDDMHDSMTQALQWLRRSGLISHNFEVAAELREAMEHRAQPKALYDV
jgi:predicted phage terminase large subunit-like protein